MKISIAVVQFEIAHFNPDINLEKVESFIKKASVNKAQIIIFPEDFVTGPLVGDRTWVDYEGKYLSIFQNLAKKYNIDIVTGSFIEGDNIGIYNTTYYIDSVGKIKGKYRKVNLWLPEREYITPGNSISVFNTKFGKVGLVICWDIIFPEMFRAMVRRGVDIVICPSYWCKGDAGRGIEYDKESEIKLVNSLSVGRAFESEIVFVYANFAGEFKYHNYTDQSIGQSQICIPFKGAIKRLEHNKEEMFIQEINTNILDDAEKSYKIKDDLKRRII